MAYAGINAARFEWLLRYGVDDEDLQRFFRESRIPLMQAGAKVQNLPYGEINRRRILVRGIPRGGDEAIGKWFRRNLTVVDPLEPTMIVGTFERVERTNGKLSESNLKELSRSCLYHLFRTDPPAELLEFLSTSLPGPDREQKPEPITSDPRDSQDTTRSSSSVDAAAVLNVLAALLHGRDPDAHLASLPADLAEVVSGMALARNGDFVGAAQAVASIPDDHILRPLYDEFVRAERAMRAQTAIPGLQKSQQVEFEGAFDHETDRIVGYCSNANTPSAVFITPIFVLRGERILALTSDVRESLFPDTGSVMAFAGPQHPRQPTRGEVGIWRVAEHETRGPHQRTRFHIVGDKQPVYEVRAVPFPSTEHDAVREYLQEVSIQQRESSTTQRLLAPVLFALQDGLVIKPERDSADLAKEESYEPPFQTWKALVAFSFEGRLFVPGPLPRTTLSYECPSLAVTVRRLFSTLRKPGEGRSHLTRGQLSELARMVDSGEAILDVGRSERVRTAVARLGERAEALDSIVAELTSQPDVRKRIDDEVNKAVTAKLDEKGELRQEIERLVKERAEWEERVRVERSQLGKLPKQVIQAVAGAFRRAQEDGIKTLGSVAVIQAVLEGSSNRSSPSAPQGIAEHDTNAPRVLLVAATGNDLRTILQQIGVNTSRSKAIAAAIEAILAGGLVVCVRGQAGRSVSLAMAGSITRRTAAVVDVPVGLINDNAVRNIISKPGGIDLILLRDANLSATELYLAPIVDLVSERIAKQRAGEGPRVMLTAADGVAALPYGRNLQRVTVAIDLDCRFSSSEFVDESLLFDPESGTLVADLWGPAVERLRETIRQLPDETQNGARAVLLSCQQAK